MRRAIGFRVLVFAASSAWASPARAGALEIQHQPLTCVPADRFGRVVARAAPPQVVRGAELQFRSDPDGPWYASAMRDEGGEWSAVLPRPAGTLDRFEYRIAMTATTGPEATPTYAVTVADDPTACAGDAMASVTSSIVVRVPPGAPVVPPVPAGFNPAGVVAAQEREPRKSNKTLIVLGSVATAGAVAAVAALGTGTSPASPPPQQLPSFAFNGTVPNPGSTIALSRDSIQVLVVMSREPEAPLTFTWRVEWRQSPSDPVCVSMSDVFVGAQRPTSLILTAPLASTGACGGRFDVAAARITIHVSDEPVWDVTLGLPFHFEP